MDLGHFSFSNHRMFWSRVSAVGVLVYLAVVPAPAYVGKTLLDVGELLGFFLLVVAALGRTWCLSYIAGMKNDVLVSDGPYSVVRNPLYGFNFVGAVGLGLAVEAPMLALLLAIGFIGLYPRVVRNEEARLRTQFGDAYLRYSAETPRWIPDWSRYREPEFWVINPRRFRQGLLDAMWFIWIFMAWEIVEEFPILEGLRATF